MAMGPTHRVAGVCAWLAVAPILPDVSWWQIGVGAVLAGATANGRLSPDADQAYYASGAFIPGGHRAVSHWFVWPLAMFAWAVWLGGPYAWQLMAVAVAWGSHDLIDMPLGKIPILPKLKGGWERAGFHLKTGGRFETLILFPACAAGIPVLGGLDIYRLAGVVPAVVTAGLGVAVWVWARVRLAAHTAQRWGQSRQGPATGVPVRVSQRPW